MISYIHGNVILRQDKFIIVEVNGIGYKVFVSRQTALKLPEIGASINASTPNASTPLGIKLFCFHNVKEEASDLYGFLTYEELDCISNSVNGLASLTLKEQEICRKGCYTIINGEGSWTY